MSGDSQQSESSQRMQLLALVVDQLACPVCVSDLKIDETRLRCAGCGRAYPMVDGIPVLIPAEQKP